MSVAESRPRRGGDRAEEIRDVFVANLRKSPRHIDELMCIKVVQPVASHAGDTSLQRSTPRWRPLARCSRRCVVGKPASAITQRSGLLILATRCAAVARFRVDVDGRGSQTTPGCYVSSRRGLQSAGPTRPVATASLGGVSCRRRSKGRPRPIAHDEHGVREFGRVRGFRMTWLRCI